MTRRPPTSQPAPRSDATPHCRHFGTCGGCSLARHGNFFHWGFAASPPEMTDEAQRVFLNTLAYMQKFAGQRPLVTGESRSRKWLPAMRSGDQPLADHVKQQLPPSWLEQKGDDRDGLRALAAAELGFLRRNARTWLVDADCKRLGLDNRQPASLRRCIELVAAGGDDAGDRLFHSDVVGQFRVAPRDLVPPHRPPPR